MSKKSYYVTGNTAEGLVNLLDSNIQNCDHVIVLKHPSKKLKTDVLKKLIKNFEKNNTVEVLLSELGHAYLQGLIIREKSMAILSDAIISPDHKSVKVIDLEQDFPAIKIADDIQMESKTLTHSAYQNFATGLEVHDDLEKVYIDQMNFDRADELTNEFITKLLNGIPKQQKEGFIFKRLFGTNTADGVVNVVPELLESVANCYFIKGRAGTGKSTFMKKIANACADHGLDVELYYCSFDPNSADMVLVKDLDVLIFDSTDPHEFFPEKKGDQIIDLYKELVTPRTDEKFAEEINELNSRYKLYMKKGIMDLKEAGSRQDTIEENYSFADDAIKEMGDNIMKMVN